MSESIVLGIDLGTSTTSAVVAIGSELRPVRLVDGLDNDVAMPTAVFVEGPDRFLVGEQAVNSSQLDPESFYENFKRKIGQQASLTTAGGRVSYTDLAAAILKHVRVSAQHEWNNDQPIPHVVLTVPLLYAEDGDSWRAMEEAARAAGFHETTFLREPHAAAMHYQHILPRSGTKPLGEGEVSLVYDLGGGTFDPALLEHTSGGFRILGSGDSGLRCGGTYFDEKLMEDFESKCPATMELLRTSSVLDGGAVDSALDRSRKRISYLRISDFLRKAKHRLSRPDCSSFQEPNPVTGEEYRISKDEFEAMILPLVDSTMAACASMVEHCNVDWARITRFLMVGGSCKIPLVRRRLENLAREMGAGGLEISCGRIGLTDRSYDPLLAVGLGAARHGIQQTLERCLREGDRHYFGDGVAMDFSRARDEYQRAAEGGHPEAQYSMGVLHAHGRGVAKDLAEAQRWYRMAAAQGHVEAQTSLGQLLISGLIGPKNPQEALQWLIPAAEANSAKAQYLVGVLYRNGQGVPQDHAEALRWLQTAVERGYTEAYAELAYLYQSGAGVDGDLGRAAELYRQGAEAGHAHCQYCLGLLCQTGQGVAKNSAESEKWFRRAAEQGYAQAQHHLGLLLSHRNSPEAVPWLQKASHQGVSAATTRLGELFAEGRLVAKDMAGARRLLEAAKAKGDVHAGAILRRLDVSQANKPVFPHRGTPPQAQVPGNPPHRLPRGSVQAASGWSSAPKPPPLPHRSPSPPPRMPPPVPPGFGTGQAPPGPKP